VRPSHPRRSPTYGPWVSSKEEVRQFLVSRRANITPAQAALPDYGEQRRVPGLRREEVAELAGVSVTWYTWLEQGRKISASAQVVDALSRALRLDGDQHRHLRRLAGLSAPPEETALDGARARLQRMVDAVAPNIASVYDPTFDYLVWNRPYVLLRNDPDALPPDRRNLLWMMFTDPENRARMLRWESAARTLLGQFRTAVGRRPDDPRLAELVAALTEASAEFREWWAGYPIRTFRPATVEIDHPVIGRIGLEMFQFRPVEYPDLVIVVQVPADGDGRHRVSALLDEDASTG
jgi:transcriptional regulator with XRE-family HTH domain